MKEFVLSLNKTTLDFLLLVLKIIYGLPVKYYFGDFGI